MDSLKYLYDPHVYYDNAESEEYYRECRGFLKKVDSKFKLPGIMGKSTMKYFRFHDKGQVLAYYDESPLTKNERPSFIAYIQEIVSI